MLVPDQYNQNHKPIHIMVPFEQIGDGQIGRLAYQVIGRDGPIFNPNNISYLPPKDAPGAANALSDMAVGFSGLSLVASVGTLSLSAITIRRLRELHESVNVLTGIAIATHQKVEDIVKRVERIDMRVAENNLREAMRHILQSAACGDQIDLKKLLPLRSDIRNFNETLSSPIYFNFGIRFASDVRANLVAICSLLANLRWFVAVRHNQANASRPNRVVTYSYSYDLKRALRIQENIQAAIAIAILDDAYTETRSSVLKSVASRFTFSDGVDSQHFAKLFDSELKSSINRIGAEILPQGQAIYHAVPEDIYIGTVDEVKSRLNEAAEVWLTKADSALLMRLDLELEALDAGYENVFWPHLIDAPINKVGKLSASVDASQLPKLQSQL